MVQSPSSPVIPTVMQKMECVSTVVASSWWRKDSSLSVNGMGIPSS